MWRSFCFFVMMLLGIPSTAQENAVDLFVVDMLKIADDFVTPAAEGAVYQASAGWFTSAEALEAWELDFAVHVNGLFIPEKKKNASISNSDYATFGIRGATTAEIPTALGGASEVVFEGELPFNDERIPFEFDALEGIQLNMIPHAFVQASLGIPVLGDLSLRWLPTLDFGEAEFGTYGIGLKHNFNQYFSSSANSAFQVAALIAYTNFKLDYGFEPVVIENIAELENIEVDANMWLLQLIGSIRFGDSNWKTFGAIGAANSDFNYLIGGGGVALAPINTELGALAETENDFKGDIGITYDAGNFLISSMFSQGKFSNLNLSLHFRL